MIDTSQPVRVKDTGETGEVVSVGKDGLSVRLTSGEHGVYRTADLENVSGETKRAGGEPRLERK